MIAERIQTTVSIMSLKSKYISDVAVYFLAVFCVLCLFFEIWRLLLLVRVHDLTAGVPLRVLAQSFLVGLRFDMVIASFITLPLFILGILPGLEISRRRWARRLHYGLLFIFATVTFTSHMVDLEFYTWFNSRLNGMALTWRDTPDMMLSMVWDMFPVVWYVLLLAASVAVFVWIILRLGGRFLGGRERSGVWVNLVWLLPVTGLLFLAARGRIEEKSPMRTGVAYFSEYDVANQLALNPNYTFWRDAIYDARDKDQLANMMADIECPGADSVVCELLAIDEVDQRQGRKKLFRPVRFESQNEDPPNIIVIIMESFGSTRLRSLGSQWEYDLAPCFDSLAEEGVLFTNFFSAGHHTYTGVFSTLTGCPHQFTELIMKQVPGQAHFKTLTDVLGEFGYRTLLFTTHDPHFDNMQGFVMSNGVDQCYSLFDFDPSKRIGTWGVPDHVMFDEALDIFAEVRPQPFFAMLLTTSNHGPWTIPDVPMERISDDVERAEELNAFKYSDWSLGRFIRKIQSDSAFSNTIVMITADNGTPYNRKLDLDITYAQIPLLILDTDSRLAAGTRIDRVGGQMDIPATALGLVGRDYDNYTFGHDLLDSTDDATDYALVSEWYRIGYVEDDYYLIHRLRNHSASLYRLGDYDHNLVGTLPELAKEYELKAKAIFKTGYYNMKRPFDKGTMTTRTGK